ncbi:hypothetical protein NQ318_011604 [Aromia moschata]|uniref:Uncharacterized protein n=1 Tax=Aromia moschata TaxID=1265417 RepID=A0AAV8Z9E0_9CUCU|nr:hypothetical protein NQ318_011604 [Aromia moschata]
MGIKSGCNLETGLRLLDEQRVKEAEKVAQASTKEGRIAARNRKRQRDEEEALAEDMYGPGQFHPGQSPSLHPMPYFSLAFPRSPSIWSR